MLEHARRRMNVDSLIGSRERCTNEYGNYAHRDGKENSLDRSVGISTSVQSTCVLEVSEGST